MRIFLLIIVVASLVGCARDEGIDLAQWTVSPCRQETVDVTLPTHLNGLLPNAACRYELRAQVALGPELRDRALVVAIPQLLAHARLTADGALAQPLEELDEATDENDYRERGPHRWAIPEAATHDGALALVLHVDHRWTQSAWLDSVPRLTVDRAGGQRFAIVRRFNETSMILAIGFTVVAAYLYLVVWLTDRKRAAFGWFALTGAAGLLYPLFQSALVARLLGPFEVTMAAIGVASSVIANLHFSYAQVGLPRPARGWIWAWALAMTLIVLSTGYFRGTQIAGFCAVMYAIPVIAWHVRLYVKLARRQPKPHDLFLLLGGWALLSVFAIPDFVSWLGLGEIAFGLHPGSSAIFTIGLLQTTALSRAHTRTLHETQVLNEELRRQIAARSRQLADALTRIGVAAESGWELSAGEVIDGRYEVVRPLGAGAGGSVYLVHRVSDRAELAMKVVNGSDPGALARLAREAQLAAQTKHPNVIAVVDVEVAHSGFLYIVMEYVAGASLRDHRGRFGDVPWALAILRQLAAGLAAVHARGIIHRDLKPANILLVPNDSGFPLVKIADFGIARPSEGSMHPADTVREGPPKDMRLTMTGMLLGTPLYMAPETIEGAKDALPSVDIFAFGVIAYEILANKLPFEESPALAQVEGLKVPAPAPIGNDVLTLPSEAAHLVDRCLSFDPAERPTAEEIARVLTPGTSS